MMKHLLTLAGALALATALSPLFYGQAKAETVRVTSCYDGDTCRTTAGERIRLACIDTPEMAGRRAQPTAAARAARDWLNARAAGREVEIRRITTDRYGRTVAELSAGGVNLQQALVASGHARIYPQYAYQCGWAR